jgi:epoxyqueuosine reductase
MDALIRLLVARGAALVGFADLATLPLEARAGLPRGVSIAVALNPGIVAEIEAGPTLAYSAEYDRTNALLDDLAVSAADHLRGRGFAAVPLAATDNAAARSDMVTPIPHKTVATLSGLGWIGKCALLITEEYGSAIRINSVLTDALVPTGAPTVDSQCGECSACVGICPGHAPSGSEWRPGMSRDDLFDAYACRQSIVDHARRTPMPSPVCGMCIAACPWTQRYLRSA